MPLKPSQILHQLQTKQADFKNFDQTALFLLQKYRASLAKAASWPHEDVTQHLRQRCLENPGAHPLEAWDIDSNWIERFHLTWQNREQSLAWVRDRLGGIATFAVDGSQIFPGKDLSIPVALVQIGWFENRHLANGGYDKDISLEVMTPGDLRVGNSGEPVDRQVNMRRFHMESDRLIQYMADHAHDPNCLVFFDGALVVTFAEAFDQETRQLYVRCVLDLLEASQTYQVPLVGYIDTSYARDLTVMLQGLFELPECPPIHDASLIHPLMNWGDRTCLFQCARSGILSQYQHHADQITFTYLKAHDGHPVRLELPRWVYEADRLPQILDWVRGELIIGGGYPYVIETADQTAVLQGQDRDLFYRILQDWAKEEGLHLRLSRKTVSKVRRRAIR